jgi:antitoxin ParD1/3/4
MTFSITLSQKLEKFIDERIQSGRFNSVADVVRAALKLLEQQEKQAVASFSTREDLEKKLIEGIESGPSFSMTERHFKTLRGRIHELANRKQS